MTIHAGEAAGPDSMRTALSYGTKRIGHGVAAIEDPELVKRLVEEGITLEVSVTSNYHTKVVDRLEDHPIHRLFDAGVRVTINSDNCLLYTSERQPTREPTPRAASTL